MIDAKQDVLNQGLLTTQVDMLQTWLIAKEKRQTQSICTRSVCL